MDPKLSYTESEQNFQPPELYLNHSIFSHVHHNGVKVYKFKDQTKPFLGGYKNKETSVEYHHAKMQTAPKKWSPSTVTLPDGTSQEIEQNSRETQTVFLKNRITQTFRDGSTQMTTPGTCYVSTATDTFLTPKPWVTAEEFHKKRLQACIKLQSFYRRWQAKILVEGVRRDKHKRLQYERDQFEKRELEKQNRLQHELERRLHPKTRADFEMLFTALEKWRKEEENTIKETLSGAEKKVAMYELLERETELIATINRHRLKASENDKQNQNIKTLEKAAAPIRWKAYDGRITEMQTQFTPRAKELLELYKTMAMHVDDNITEDDDNSKQSSNNVLNRSERYDALMTLILTVTEHKCKLTEEIIQLAKREQDLLNRGTHENNLNGLRQRISTLLFQYCREPVFNPEAARILKVPVEQLNAGAVKYQLCTNSQKYMPTSEFELGATKTTNTKWTSKAADRLDNEARKRIDNAPFRRMLKTIREIEAEEGEPLPYLLAVDDIRWLVMDNWGGSSLLSASSDLNELELVRWDRSRPWSPWNCILLSTIECEAHLRLVRLEDTYGRQLRDRVRRRHAAARQHFTSLTKGLTEALREKTNGSWSMSVGPSEVVGKRL